MKGYFVLGLTGALALAACNNAADDSAASDDQESIVETPSVAAEAAASPDTSTPQGFVNMAASSDMYEVEAGRLAQQAGSSDAVKAFGAMMEKDHTASSEKLKAAVTEAGGGLVVPGAMQPRHRQQLDQLRAAGETFDAVYAQQQVAAHEEALALMKAQAASGTSAPLKTHASAAAPVIEGHLDHARELP